jgi:hypothetical protein
MLGGIMLPQSAHLIAVVDQFTLLDVIEKPYAKRNKAKIEVDLS